MSVAWLAIYREQARRQNRRVIEPALPLKQAGHDAGYIYDP